MTEQYEIIDIYSQTAEGVVYLAEHKETEEIVKIHRLRHTPSITDIDAWNENFRQQVKQIVANPLPELCRIIHGDADPIDKVPFLIKEYREGLSLAGYLNSQGLLTPPQAHALILTAIGLCRRISEITGEERVWIDTAPDHIHFQAESILHPYQFEMSLSHWLTPTATPPDLSPLRDLLEYTLGWTGRVLQHSSGSGLGAWVRTLRDNPQAWTLEEAQLALENIDVAPIPSARQENVVRKAPAKVFQSKKSDIWKPWLVAGVLSLIGASIFVWNTRKPRLSKAQTANLALPTAVSDQTKEPVPKKAPPAAKKEKKKETQPKVAKKKDSTKPKKSKKQTPAQVVKASSPSSDNEADAISARAAELAAKAAQGERFESTLTKEESSAQYSDSVGESVQHQGQLIRVRATGTGKTIYLEFSYSRDTDSLSACFRTRMENAPTLEELEKYVGKTISVKGTVVREPSRRLTIELSSIDDLTLVSE